MIETLKVRSGQGLHDVTESLNELLHRSALEQGLCTVFIQHTSASLLIQENADPDARRDLEKWLDRLVPENDELYTHVMEGPDDMPAHIKSMLTQSSLSIPFAKGKLMLGTWQGVYLFEHRTQSHQRRLVVHLQADPENFR